MKKDKLYYQISEVALKVGVTTQTIRNWVSTFPQLKVHKDENGRRYFTKNNILILKKIYKLRNKGLSVKAIRDYFSKRVDKNIENIIIAIDKIIERIDRLT